MPLRVFVCVFPLSHRYNSLRAAIFVCSVCPARFLRKLLSCTSRVLKQGVHHASCLPFSRLPIQVGHLLFVAPVGTYLFHELIDIRLTQNHDPMLPCVFLIIGICFPGYGGCHDWKCINLASKSPEGCPDSLHGL